MEIYQPNFLKPERHEKIYKDYIMLRKLIVQNFGEQENKKKSIFDIVKLSWKKIGFQYIHSCRDPKESSIEYYELLNGAIITHFLSCSEENLLELTIDLINLYLIAVTQEEKKTEFINVNIDFFKRVYSILSKKN